MRLAAIILPLLRSRERTGRTSPQLCWWTAVVRLSSWLRNTHTRILKIRLRFKTGFGRKQRRRIPMLKLDEANRAIAAALKYARERGYSVSVTVCDPLVISLLTSE